MVLKFRESFRATQNIYKKGVELTNQTLSPQTLIRMNEITNAFEETGKHTDLENLALLLDFNAP